MRTRPVLICCCTLVATAVACGGKHSKSAPVVATRLALVSPPGDAVEDSATHFSITAVDSSGDVGTFNGTIAITAFSTVAPTTVVMSNGHAEVDMTFSLTGDEVVTFTAAPLVPVSQGIYVAPAIPSPVTGPATRGSVLAAGSGWDAAGAWAPALVVTSGTFRLYYASSAGTANIGLATSPDGLVFTRNGANPLVGPAVSADACHAGGAGSPDVFRAGNKWRMIYRGKNGSSVHLCTATSTDGVAWTPEAGAGPFGSVLAAVLTTASGFDTTAVTSSAVVETSPGHLAMIFGGEGFGDLTPDHPGPEPLLGIGLAVSTDGGLTWTQTASVKQFGSLAVGSPLSPDDFEWDAYGIPDASVLQVGTAFRIWATGYGTGFAYYIGRFGTLNIAAIGPELDSVVVPGAVAGRFDEVGALEPSIVRGPDGTLRLYYTGIGSDGVRRIGLVSY